MWPFGDPPSSRDGKAEDISEAEVQRFFSQIDQPSARTGDGSREPEAIGRKENQKLQDSTAGPPRQQEEEPCNLQYYFDEFFMCYTPKSQLRNWYRYGEKKDCSERWRDFKWCMRTRMTDEDAAQQMLKDRKLDMDRKVHSRPNSEDIWDARKSPLAAPWTGESSTDYSIS